MYEKRKKSHGGSLYIRSICVNPYICVVDFGLKGPSACLLASYVCIGVCAYICRSRFFLGRKYDVAHKTREKGHTRKKLVDENVNGVYILICICEKKHVRFLYA